MSRQRMYLFERAYVDYAAGLRRFVGNIRRTCADIWGWFWSGAGAIVIEILLRLAIVITAIGLGLLYIRYENDQGRGFSAGMFFALVGIVLFTLLVLWGWKAPVHLVARALSGTTASGLILALAALAIAVAIVVFTPYLLALFALTALSFVVFLPMRAYHTLWLLYRRIAYRCPYEDDGGAHGLPIHICSCGRRYDDLQPSFYGIFHHTCRHADGTEEKLPTLDFLGRNKLDRLCRGCRRPLALSSFGELAERPIVVVGGPFVGKTIFLRQATRQLRERLSALPGGTVRIDPPAQERELDADLLRLDSGETLAKTSGDAKHAFGLAVRVPGRLRCLLYLFDAPGEDFLTVERFGQKRVLQHVTGITLLVDPFSLPALAERAQNLSADIRPSQTPFQRVVDILIASVNLMLIRRPTDRCDVPLAVVLTKADAFPTTDFPFLAGLCPDHARPPDESLSARCQGALKQLGGERGVRMLEQKFVHVRYFACTTLGRIPGAGDTRPFQPVGVAEPLLWLLGEDRVAADQRRPLASRDLSRI